VDVPEPLFDKMCYLRDHADGLRKFLLFEPRGAAVHSANLVLPTSNPRAQVGFVIMESTEYPPMSGSNTICTVTALLETGIVPLREPVTEFTLEAGRLSGGNLCVPRRKRLQVKFRNVPSSFIIWMRASKLRGWVASE
jgi:proline racemase